MNEKTAQRLANLLKNIDSGAVQKDEFLKVFSIFLAVLKELKSAFETGQSSVKGELSNGLKQASYSLKELGIELREAINNLEKKGFSDTKDFESRILSEIKRVENMIPDVTDLSPLERKVEEAITELEAKIPTLPEELKAEKIRDKLESLKGEERLDKSSIRGLEEAFDELKKVLDSVRSSSSSASSGGVSGRDLFQDIDISSQLDGVTKTFNIPGTWRIISVDLSSFPYGALRKGIDYTYTPTSITFTSEIDAATQLAEGQTCILTVVIA